MFMHGSWDHILGNMLFLVVFGKNVEDAFGHIWYLIFYFAGGLAAMLTQTLMTLAFGTVAEARTPNLGASGAIAAVLGAFFVLYPTAQVTGLVVIFPVRVSAWFFLGFWFLYQLVEGNFGIFSATSRGGGVAFFAHVGGFIFGVIVAAIAVRARWIRPQQQAARPAPAEPGPRRSAGGALAPHALEQPDPEREVGDPEPRARGLEADAGHGERLQRARVPETGPLGGLELGDP